MPTIKNNAIAYLDLAVSNANIKNIAKSSVSNLSKEMMGNAPPLIIPMSKFKREGDIAIESATQEAFWAQNQAGEKYRIKQNPPTRMMNTFHEVVSARVLNVIGFSCSPCTSWVPDHSGKIWVASPVVEGMDVGKFLLENGLKHCDQKSAKKYQNLVKSYEENERFIDTLKSTPAVERLLAKYPKGGVTELTDKDHEILQPLRDAYRENLKLQEKMYDFLPRPIKSELAKSLYMSEIVGEWDFLNHSLYNTLISAKDKDVSVRVVDRGVSGLVGFGGLPKRDNSELAMHPARIDDPYLKGGTSSIYPHHSIDARLGDLDLTRPSKTNGLIGSIPRSSVYAFVLKDVVKNEADGYKSSPAEFLDVALHLKHLDDGVIQDFFNDLAIHLENHSSPEIRKLASPEVTGVSNIRDLGFIYTQRISLLIERANQNNELDRWERSNPITS